LKGSYELSLLKTTTVVGTGEMNLAAVKMRTNASRNCSRRVATSRIFLSPALPTITKFLERARVQVSFAVAGLAGATSKRHSISVKRLISFISRQSLKSSSNRTDTLERQVNELKKHLAAVRVASGR
jgi:hypothetical protein